jgi:hypothetical protein
VLGPFLAVRLLRDDVRVTTPQQEYPLPRVADWVYYSGVYYAYVEIVGTDQMGKGRTQRRLPFDPYLATIAL